MYLKKYFFYFIERRFLSQNCKFSNKNYLLCAWMVFNKKICVICTYNKWATNFIPIQFWVCKQTDKNYTFYRFQWHHPLITQLSAYNTFFFWKSSMHKGGHFYYWIYNFVIKTSFLWSKQYFPKKALRMEGFQKYFF